MPTPQRAGLRGNSRGKRRKEVVARRSTDVLAIANPEMAAAMAGKDRGTLLTHKRLLHGPAAEICGVTRTT